MTKDFTSFTITMVDESRKNISQEITNKVDEIERAYILHNQKIDRI